LDISVAPPPHVGAPSLLFALLNFAACLLAVRLLARGMGAVPGMAAAGLASLASASFIAMMCYYSDLLLGTAILLSNSDIMRPLAAQTLVSIVLPCAAALAQIARGARA